MKHKSFFVAMLLLVCATSMWASDTQVGGIWYDFDRYSLTASVTYRGNKYDSYTDEYSGSVVIPKSVVYKDDTYTVTSIGEYAFYECSSLISVTIPNSVTSIGNYAFQSCRGLTSVNIPNNVTSIGYNAFLDCISLNVTIPNEVRDIKEFAFSNVLNIIYLGTATGAPWGARSINGFVDGWLVYSDESKTQLLACSAETIGEISIPNSVNSIGNRAFYMCNSLTEVSIPNSVISIGDEAFYNCISLTSVTIPNSVTNIGYSAFLWCQKLTSPIYNAHVFAYMPTSYSGAYTIPDDIESIAGGAFLYCRGLTSVTIPTSVTSIGSIAFNSCSGLTSVTIPENITSIGRGAFGNCTSLTTIQWNAKKCTTDENLNYNNHEYNPPFGNLSNITNFSFGENVEIIPAILCYGLSGLITIKIPDKVIGIGRLAFYGCSGLTSVTIGNSVTSIGDEAFKACSSLKKVNISDITTWCNISFTGGSSANPLYYAKHLFLNDTEISDLIIPDSTTNIGDYAFYNCSSLTSVTIPNSVTSIGGSAFYGCSNLTDIYATCGDRERVKQLLNNDSRVKYILPYSIISKAENGHVNSVQNSCDTLELSAVPDYGYHFTQWTDGNTDNPRTIELTQDTILIAEFAINNYNVDVQANYPGAGDLTGAGSYEYGSSCTISATTNYGYQFVTWETDSSYPMPANAITPSKAYSIAAALKSGAKTSSQYTIVGYVTGKYGTYSNSYYLSDAPNKVGNFIVFKCQSSANIGDWVEVTGYLTNYKGTTPETTSGATLQVIQNLNSNPFAFEVTNDILFTAIFSKNKYTIGDRSDSEKGYISGIGEYEYLDKVVLRPIPQYGYHFTQWSDGNTDNPRTIVVTKNTTYTAEFAIDKYGKCGDDNALTWTYDDKNVLTISGSGALNSNYTFGLEAPENMQKVVIESGVSSVGNGAFKNHTTLKEIAISHGVITIADEAFAGCTEVATLTLGANLQSIGENAFNGCKRIDEITVYAERVIDITETTFANIGNKKYVYVYVPEASLRKYQRDDYWSEFDLRVIGATTTTVAEDEVNVEPTTNTADVTWPAVDNAATYELTIKDKSGNVICTLIFNAQGQLTSIAFAAPGRGQRAAQVAGFTFTVTGLDSGSSYGFTMQAKDSQGEVLDTKEGSFTTAETSIATAIDNASVDTKPVKVISDGQLFILRDGKAYTIQGQEVR